jgi:hypothetical protein
MKLMHLRQAEMFFYLGSRMKFQQKTLQVYLSLHNSRL